MERRIRWVAVGMALAVLAGAATGAATNEADGQLDAGIQESYGKLPLQFEENHGQTDGRVKFLARGAGYTLFLTEREAMLALRHGGGNASGANLRMVLEGTSATARISGSEALPGKMNYFRGNDSANWRSGIGTWQKVKYEQVYPGIDLVFYGKQGQFEFDFVAAPGADPRAIRFRVEGADASVDASGDVALTVSGETVTMKRPVVYQVAANGSRTQVDGRFVVGKRNEIGFAVGEYDRERPLVIDPVLLYASYLGGSQDDQITGLAVDRQDGAYVVGYSSSANFPTTTGAFQAQQPVCAPGDCTSANGPDAFVARISPDGSRLVYATYLGGNNEDAARAIAVDAAGNAYVTGYTFSNDFPMMHPYQSICGPQGVFNFGSGLYTGLAASCEGHPAGEGLVYSANAPDVFVTKLSPGGDQLLYSTYLGGTGNDQATAIGLDAAGNIYVAGITSSIVSSSVPVYPLGSSVAFPTTPSAYGDATHTTGGGFRAFLTVFNPDGQTLRYSSIFGGPSGGGVDEVAQGLGVGQNGFASIGGQVRSPSMPTKNAIQSSCALLPGNASTCAATGFLAGFDTTKSGDASLVFATYLGGATPSGAATDVNAVTVDANNNVFATGTSQARDFAYTAGSYSPHCSDASRPDQYCNDSFVLKANAAGALSWATSYGTGVQFCPAVTSNAIAVDQAGAVYIAGNTGGCGIPLVDPIPFTYTGGDNAFVAALSGDGSHLVFGAMYGGSVLDTATALAVDGFNNIYVAGTTNSSNLTVTPGAFQAALAGGAHDGFIIKISPLYVANATTLSVDPNPAIPGATVNFTAAVTWSDGKPAPTGTVTFFDSTTALATRAVGANGFAFFSTNSLAAGAHSITAGYSGDGNYGPSVSAPVSLTVGNPLAQTTTTAAAAFATYSPGGQNVTLSATVVGDAGPVNGGTVAFLVFGSTTSGAVTNGSASVSFPIPAGSVAGNYIIQATYTPASGFAGSSDSAHSLAIGKATPTVSWSNPADIVSGTALSATQLNATASVPGVFVYTPASGAVLAQGSGQTLSTTFTPTDTTDYSGTSASVHINVTAPPAATTTTAASAQATYGAGAQNVTLSASVTATSGTVTGGSVGFTVFGTTIGGAVANGAASVSFPIPAGMAAGSYPIQAVYTPAGNFTASSDNTKSLAIGKATPVITWVNPADITTGTALGATQLNATANVPGVFVYTPASGAVLAQGSGQTLSTTFTPTDTTDYLGASASVHINVTAGASATTLTATGARATYSPVAQNVTLSATVTSTAGTVTGGSVGFTVFGTTLSGAVVNGATSVSFPIPAGKSAGSYAVQAVYTPAGNFTGSSDNTKSLAIGKATPVITWNPAPIYETLQLGTSPTYGPAQLDAAANVQVSFVYLSPPTGVITFGGPQPTLNTTFTPTDSVDYNTVSTSAAVPVLQRLQYSLRGVPVAALTATFAPQIVSTTSAPINFMVVNAGPDDIPISVGFGDPFFLVNSCGTKYPAHTACTLSVTFSPHYYIGPGPANLAEYNVAGVISYNAGSFPFAFSGTVIPGNPSIKMTLAGTGTEYGYRYADINVTNNGTGYAWTPEITQITIRPAGTLGIAPPFLIANGALRIGASATVRVFVYEASGGGFVMTLSGSLYDSLGAVKTFSSLVVVPPPQP